MRVGYWSSPDGDDVEMTLLPVGHDGGASPQGMTGSGAVSALATRSGEELRQQCPLLASTLALLAEALATQSADGGNQIISTDQLSAAERALLFDILGEGEVSGIVALPDRRVAQIQESVMTGLWRVRIEADAEQPQLDYLEIGDVPGIVAHAARDFTATEFSVGEPPDGIMNVMPVLAEIRDRMSSHRAGRASHVINFTLLPMSAADMAHLVDTLGNGPIQLFSRGYGSCRVLATGVRHVWSVQFLNSMETPILDTIEIGDVPAAVCAATEDFRDSAERLGEIIEAYFR